MALPLMVLQSLVEKRGFAPTQRVEGRSWGPPHQMEQDNFFGYSQPNWIGNYASLGFGALSPHAAPHGSRPYYGPYGRPPRPNVGCGSLHALGHPQGDVYDGVCQPPIAGCFSRPSSPFAPPHGPVRGPQYVS
ncbi:hypothetical protein GOBAR_AA21328 [Gossypium barbadense]|uniref:Uncharacterized protein n=1 Tax=Gossypium barbadense TaxID=3634 RepID=A0A2P5X7L9_GOSBA|nr:hypothetical protein GOBAR_AA21328 [Gossypium barbadense]